MSNEKYEVDYETTRRFYDEYIRPHTGEDFDSYCNRQLLQQAQAPGKPH